MKHKKLSIWNKKVLVLNKNWQALGITRMPRALSLLTSEYKDHTVKAKIISNTFQILSWEEWELLTPEDGDDVLIGVSKIYKAPQAIKLERCEKFAKVETAFNKQNLFYRDRNQCQYCGTKPGFDQLSMDHIVPKSVGGKTNWINCITACKSCNFKKANKSLEESGMKLLSTPCKPTFDPVLKDCQNKDTWPELWKKLVTTK